MSFHLLVFFKCENTLRESYNPIASPAFPFSLKLPIYFNFCPYHSSKIAFIESQNSMVNSQSYSYSTFWQNLMAFLSSSFLRVHSFLLYLLPQWSFISFANTLNFPDPLNDGMLHGSVLKPHCLLHLFSYKYHLYIKFIIPT